MTVRHFTSANSAASHSAPASRGADEGGGRNLLKGRQTKATIVDAALGLASQIGLEGLAEVTGMSKSGVFAHFGSREELQISVIREYHDRFETEVFYPALSCARGLPRLQSLFDNWMQRTSTEIDSGCIYISGAVEFDDRPGSVQAQKEKHLSDKADPLQVAFEIHGLILALHYEARFLRNPGAAERARKGFTDIVARHKPE